MMMMITLVLAILALWVGHQANARVNTFSYICNGEQFPAGDEGSFKCAEDLLRDLIVKVPKSAWSGIGSESDTKNCPDSGIVIKAWVDTGAASDAQACLDGAMNVLHNYCYNSIGARVHRDGDDNVCLIKYDKQ